MQSGRRGKLELCEVGVDDFPYVSYLCLWGISQKQKEAMREHMERRFRWIEEMMAKGLKIVLALGPRKSKRGLIEYLPIKDSVEPVKGEDSLFINCIWVLPRLSKAGVGRTLMQHFLKEAKKVGGATVLAYEGDKWFGYFDYMPASFFKRFGFEEVSRDETRSLLHLDLGAHQPPTLLTPKSMETGEKGKTVLDVFCNSQCPWCGWMADVIQKNSREYSNVKVNIINTDNRETIEEFGMARGVSINGKPIIKRMAHWKEIITILDRRTNVKRVD